MRVMVMVKATKNSEAGLMPGEELLTAMGKFNEELVKAGIMLAGDGLHPTAKGKRVRFSGGNRTVADGPFAETKELVAGYWIWQVKSMDEALAWIRRCPDPMPGEESEIEIRPLFEADDFGKRVHPGTAGAGGARVRRGLAPAQVVGIPLAGSARIYTHLWYARDAEAAARLYASSFPDSRVDRVHFFRLMSQFERRARVRPVEEL